MHGGFTKPFGRKKGFGIFTVSIDAISVSIYGYAPVCLFNFTSQLAQVYQLSTLDFHEVYRFIGQDDRENVGVNAWLQLNFIYIFTSLSQFIPRLQHQTPRAVFTVQPQFLLFQHAEGFAGEEGPAKGK